MNALKSVVESYVDAFNQGDLEKLCSLFAPEALIWGVLGWGTVDKVKPIWSELIDCLQINLQIEGLIAEDTRVAARYIERGRSVKPFMGHDATGRTYELTAMEWFEIKNGLIHCRWGARDSGSQFRQLGFIS